jgi:hypothetical protein
MILTPYENALLFAIAELDASGDQFPAVRAAYVAILRRELTNRGAL